MYAIDSTPFTFKFIANVIQPLLFRFMQGKAVDYNYYAAHLPLYFTHYRPQIRLCVAFRTVRKIDEWKINEREHVDWSGGDGDSFGCLWCWMHFVCRDEKLPPRSPKIPDPIHGTLPLDSLSAEGWRSLTSLGALGDDCDTPAQPQKIFNFENWLNS